MNRYLGGFCSSQRIFPPQTIQVLLFTLISETVPQYSHPCLWYGLVSLRGKCLAVHGRHVTMERMQGYNWLEVFLTATTC
jgi:hypothetical protein